MTHTIGTAFIGFVLALALGSATYAIAAPVSVVQFTPHGETKQVRQVTARFSAPMVALGEPRAAAPFVVRCAPPGHGRWADGYNWVYDFDAELPGGVRCSFVLRDRLTTLDKTAVTGERHFTFDTGGPAIQASLPSEGDEEIDERQAFLLRLDGTPTPATISQHAYCVIEGLAERVPVDVLSGPARQSILAQRERMGYAYYNVLWKNGEGSQLQVRDRKFEQAEARLTVVQCRRTLPPATKVQLVWDAGIAASSGVTTRTAQRLSFRVRPEFSARLTCTRTEPRAGCTPVQPITVEFNAPVPLAQALGVRLRIGPNDMRTPDSTAIKQAKVVQTLTFRAPFPESVTATLTLPEHLTDDAGRPLTNAPRFPLSVRIDAYPPLVKFAAQFGIVEAGEGGVLPVTLRNIDVEGAPNAATKARPTTINGRTLRVAVAGDSVGRWLRRVAQANESRGESVPFPDGPALPNAAQNAGAAAQPPPTRWRENTGSTSVFNAADATTPLVLPKPLGARPAEVVGIALGRPGLYIVELQSRRLGAALLGRDATRYVSSAALVTNLAVHLKWGRTGSRVWVTRLDTGAPVANAHVAISDYCTGKSRWQGDTGQDGVAKDTATLGEPTNTSADCDPYSDPTLIATATLGDDTGFVLSSWDNGIDPYHFGLETGTAEDTLIAHTVLDRALFRPGETVSMKHFLRTHGPEGMSAPDRGAGTRTIVIGHLGSDEHYEMPVRFAADSTAEQTWQIPAAAKRGEYEISIRLDKDRSLSSGSFKVADFRLPTMIASVQGSPRPLVRPRTATLDVHVGYTAGGSAATLPVKLRTLVETSRLPHPGYEDFAFDGDPVRLGVVTDDRSAHYYADGDDGDAPDGEDTADADTAKSTPKAQVLPLTLDAQGAARVTIAQLPVVTKPSVLTAELEYPDPNGELLTTTGRVRLLPAALSVGIRREGWVATDAEARFRVVVLDLDGKPLAGHPVAVTLYKSARYSYRKRLIGGFYTYESARENTLLPATCAGTTNAQGLLLCTVASGTSGELLVRAEARDADRQVAGATTSLWVVGHDEWWFGGTDGDRMDLLPERAEYEAGQHARLQVRMPFRTATALVTVEREGVLSSFVTTLSGRAPVVEIPIEAAYAPNIYVSVLAVRGRVPAKRWHQSAEDGQEISALVDLNKPAYRLGEAQIKVGWRPHRLDVRVTPARATYGVRDRAQVHITVRRADRQPLPAGAEVALAAVDETLLQLAPNPSWQLLDAMMDSRGLEVLTSTAQMQVVGKRHYGRKAVPHGGGGGRDRARESFDTLLAWQGRVRLDANGAADVTIPLNDSLTSFRIVAVAHAGSQLFGTGSSNIVTSQTLILLSGLPPLARDGDRYAATFTVRNTGKIALPVTVTASATPEAPAAPGAAATNAAATTAKFASPQTAIRTSNDASRATSLTLAAQQFEIPAGGARDVTWQVTAPNAPARLTWNVSARGGGAAAASDQLRVTQEIIPAFPVRTQQATITQLNAPLTIPVARPGGALAGYGGVEVALSARLAGGPGGGLSGVRDYMRAYPYDCIEQSLSRAVALHDRALWDSVSARLPAYLDDDGLLRYFPSTRLPGDDTLTAYVLTMAAEVRWVIPTATATRMLVALDGFVAGRVIRYSTLSTADLTVRKLAAINALAHYGAAKPQMLDSISIEPNLWPTSAVLDWLGILRRVDAIPKRVAQRAAALATLRSRLSFQGTTLVFSSQRRDALWWLMVSADSNAARTLLAVLDEPEWRADVPRLARGLLGRQQRGHWNTTPANAWGALAMTYFSQAFESTPVTGTTHVKYGGQRADVTYPSASAPSVVAGAGAGEAAKTQYFPWQNGTLPLVLTHAGAGHPWALVRTTAALPLRAPLSAGYAITRNVTPVVQQRSDRWTRGDVARVRLTIDASADMTWVVVDDPVPAGASVLSSGLGGQSQLLAKGEQRAGWVWPAFEERTFAAFRAYYRYVPQGRFVAEYTMRLNNPGTFLLPPTHVEAMYAPEVMGELPNAALVVAPP